MTGCNGNEETGIMTNTVLIMNCGIKGEAILLWESRAEVIKS